jgi:hypothetical protein
MKSCWLYSFTIFVVIVLYETDQKQQMAAHTDDSQSDNADRPSDSMAQVAVA